MDRVAKSGKRLLSFILFRAILVIGLLFNISAYAQVQENVDNDNSNVKLLSSTRYNDSIDYLHVIGEVQNTSPDAQKYIKVTATFYDSTNRIVGTGFTFTDVDVLRPGEKSPFDVILDNKAQSEKVQNYRLVVSSDNTEPKPANLKLTIGDNYYDDIGYVHVLGEVTNQGTEITRYAKVSGSFYNEQNQIVATDFTFTEPSDLMPGQSAPFDTVISDHASTATYGRMSSGSLNVQSSDYAMILPAVTFIIDGESDDGHSSVNSRSGNSNNDDDSNGNGNSDGNCDSSYPTVCIKSPPPDLNCDDVPYKNFKVTGRDPHGFDRDNDGFGCDSANGGSNGNGNKIKPPICPVNPEGECPPVPPIDPPDPCDENPDAEECRGEEPEPEPVEEDEKAVEEEDNSNAVNDQPEEPEEGEEQEDQLTN